MKVEFTGVLVAQRHLPDWGGLAGAIHAATVGGHKSARLA